MNSKSPIRNNAPLGQLVIQLDEQICMLRCFYCTEQPALDTITCTMTTSRWNLDLICKVWHIHLQRLTTDDAQTNEQTRTLNSTNGLQLLGEKVKKQAREFPQNNIRNCSCFRTGSCSSLPTMGRVRLELAAC